MTRLKRPASAQTPALQLQALLNPQNAALQIVPLEQIQLIPGFNPRFQGLTSQEQGEALSSDALFGLVASMKELVPETGQPRGVIQPLLVRPLNGRGYAIIAGERRYHAAKLAGLLEVPVVVRDVSEREALALAIIENAQRQDTDQITQALAGFHLMSTVSGLSEDELVRHLGSLRRGQAEDIYQLEQLLQQTYGTGVSTWSQQRAKVLELSSEERAAVQRGHLSAKSVFALTKLKSYPEQRQALLQSFLKSSSPPSAEEVSAAVQNVLQQSARPEKNHHARLKALLPRVKRADQEKKAQLDALLEKLEQLLT
jgi:ParB family chromosome partitioning protein